MLVLFFFELEFYEKQNILVSYVGYLFVDVLLIELDCVGVLECFGFDENGQYIVLLLGSCQFEVDYMVESFIEIGKFLLQCFFKVQFLVLLIMCEMCDCFELVLWKCGVQEMVFKMLFGYVCDVLVVFDVVLVVSGIVMLEMVLIKMFMVIVYKMLLWIYCLMKNKGYQFWIGLFNILVGEFVVLEFVQDDVMLENMVQVFGNLIVDKVVCKQIIDVFYCIYYMFCQGMVECVVVVILLYLLLDVVWVL